MISEYQIVYCETLNGMGGARTSEPKTLNVFAEDKTEAGAPFEKAGLKVLGCTRIRAVVDWEKPVWDLDEFGAAMGIKGRTLSGKKGSGTIPWSAEARGVPRRLAMKWIENGLNEPGRKLLAELKEEDRK